VTEDAGSAATLQQFEQALLELESARYDFTLFVAGASSLSARAVGNMRALCETYLEGRYELRVVDVHRNPELVSSRGVLASPTLFKDHPLPTRVLVGNLADTAHVLRALDIVPAPRRAPGDGATDGHR
jgi:circadian clock protein KaiB